MGHLFWITALLCAYSLTRDAHAGFIIQPKSTEGIQGETVVLSCQIQDETGAIVVWYRNSVQLSIDGNLVDAIDADMKSRYSVVGNSTEGEFSLQISNVKRSDEGEYFCSFISRLSGAQSPHVSLTVLIPPSAGSPRCRVFAETPQNSKSTFWPGDVASLSCESSGGDPAANLTWFRSNWTVTASKKRTNVYRRILTRGDNGVTFVCMATSPALREPRKCTVTPMVIPPEVHVRPQSSSILVGSNATFHCEVTAITRVLEHNWFMDGNLLTAETPGIAFDSSGKVLVIVNTQVEHGSKTIECEAVIENNLQARAGSTVVVVPPKKTDPPPSTPTQKVTIVEIENSEVPTLPPFITADMNLIIVVVSGSLIVLLLLIAIIMGCWVFGFRKPRRPNTRVNIDYGEVPADMPLDGISHYSVPAAMFSTEMPDTRGPNLIHHSSNMDENASGYITALYATMDKNKRTPTKMVGASSYPEKPIAQITPTASRGPMMQYDTTDNFEKRKSGAIAYSDLKDTEDELNMSKGCCSCDCKANEYEKEDPDTQL